MSNSEQQIQHEQKNIEIVNENVEEMEIEAERSDFSEDFQSDEEVVPEIQIDNQQKKQIQSIPKVTNPISAYSVFMKQWRQQHKGQKVSMSAIGQIWKQLNKEEKEMYQRKFRQQKQRYEQYQTLMLSIDPNFGKKNKESSKNYFFPLHRVKAIMKLDNAFTATTQNVSTMAKCAEYFGQYLLEQVKKLTQSKKRVDINDLFEAINNNQSNLWFLNCLIDQHNLQNTNPNRNSIENKKQKVHKMTQQKNQQPKQQKRQIIHTKTQKSAKPSKTPKSKKDIPKGQLKLTDMF